ncbi:cell division protein FtsL [Spirochaetia bacterium 38H-sp]|uniref:Cell division protein FtsL n=1 Tax=Rarispira pelagica TaxID=3141764 RepID=A0ABU9UDE9_9SPIR
MRMFKYIATVSILILFSLLIFQSYKYQELEKKLLEIQQKQEELVEENKRLIAAIEVMSSPQRIEKIAKDGLGLEKVDRNKIITIEVK